MTSRTHRSPAEDTTRNQRPTFSGWPQVKAVRNALRTGHCAPTVMRTLAELHGTNPEPMLRLVSAMGGGVGMLRNECGAASSPILFLGLLYGDETGPDGIPKVITLGRTFFQQFESLHGGIRCREVAATFQNVFACLQAMRRAPKLVINCIQGDATRAMAGSTATELPGYAELLKEFDRQKFHCALNVLNGLSDTVEITEQHLRAAKGLVGGTVMQGMTCSALTAGVLAIGLQYGRIESSYLRVPKLLFKIAAGHEFMDERYNAFNKSMNIGSSLGMWFKEQFGSTECKDILGKDLSTHDGAGRYIAENDMDRCRAICEGVISRVREMVQQTLTPVHNQKT